MNKIFDMPTINLAMRSTLHTEPVDLTAEILFDSEKPIGLPRKIDKVCFIFSVSI